MQDKPIEQAEKAIELKNVAVHYTESKSLFKREKYQALKDISFDVYKGETLGIIGRNGAGKSTLLRLLAGIIKPDKGEVIHHCKSVSLMALAAGFDPNLSGRQNAMISGMLIGHSKKEMLSKLDEIKEFSELGDFFEKPVKTYSSGMSARLGFATAMHTHPDVLLIDEVLAVGDANFKQKAEKAITDKIQSDITVILVSHSEQQMKRLCDRVVWVQDGNIINQGSTISIFTIYNYTNQFLRFKLKLNVLNFNYDYFLYFEEIKVLGEEVCFDLVLISKSNVNISDVTVLNNNECVVMDGPFSCPKYSKIHPNSLHSNKSRYKYGKFRLSERNIITINDSSVDVISILIE